MSGSGETTDLERGVVAATGAVASATVTRAAAANESDWQALGIMHRKSISTIAPLDLRGDEALYSLEGGIEYCVKSDRTELMVVRYEGRGVPLEQPHMGRIEYCNEGPWIAAVRADRTFEARGTFLWRDASNGLGLPVPTVLRGTLLDDDGIAYVSTTTDIRGASAGGGPGPIVYLQVPAVW